MHKCLRLTGVVIAMSVVGAPATFAVAQASAGWSYGIGPGMMGGDGASPGTLGSYGPRYGMGPSKVGFGYYKGLDLSADQKAKISQIERDVQTKYWAVIGKMMESQNKLQELHKADQLDTAAINKQYKELEDLRAKCWICPPKLAIRSTLS